MDMRSIVLLPAAAFIIAACTQTRSPEPTAAALPPPSGSAEPSTSLSANPPDTLTGSQAYQSPDLPRRLRPVGGN